MRHCLHLVPQTMGDVVSSRCNGMQRPAHYARHGVRDPVRLEVGGRREERTQLDVEIACLLRDQDQLRVHWPRLVLRATAGQSRSPCAADGPSRDHSLAAEVTRRWQKGRAGALRLREGGWVFAWISGRDFGLGLRWLVPRRSQEHSIASQGRWLRDGRWAQIARNRTRLT